MKLNAFVLFLLSTMVMNLSAQTFTILHNFNGAGADPSSGLVLLENTLYGTTYVGGNSGKGTVFKINTDGTSFTNLHNFTATTGPFLTNSDGAWPSSSLILSSNTLYGTASKGGNAGYGLIFKINTNGTGFASLHSFATGNTNSSGLYTNSDGIDPAAGLILSGSALYGTTLGGGVSGSGTVFKINTDGTDFTNLHIFTALSAFKNSDGAVLQAGLILSGDTLFGTTEEGGSSGYGTVFAVRTDGTGFTNLHYFHSFFSDYDGENPDAGLILSGHTLYGTTFQGGTSFSGTVFAINIDGTGFTNIYNFTGGNDGGLLEAGLVLSGDTLYGTALSGGNSGYGTVFAVDTNGNGFMTLHSFTAPSGSSSTNSDGANPQAELLFSNNILYGTTVFGGGSGYGTIFAVDLIPSAPSITNQPLSQFVQVGTNVNFSVTAYGSSPLAYQWFNNGTAISDATNTTFSITNVQFADARNYSVMVSNPYGYVLSSSAKLSVVAVDTSIPTKQINPNALPSIGAGKDSLCIVTHGFIPAWSGPAQMPDWVPELASAISNRVPSNWLVVPLDWSKDAWGLTPEGALLLGRIDGTLLGQQLSKTSWSHIHLIAHSAGAGLIQAIADILNSSPSYPQIQLTFLDPYVGEFHENQGIYGRNANWSDCYSVEDFTGGWTAGSLTHAYNVDVSWVDPARQIVPWGLSEIAFSSHEYTHDFYLDTVTNTSPSWCGYGYGFALGEETPLGWTHWSSLLPGNAPLMLCGSADALQNPSPGLALSLVAMSDANHAISSFGASLLSNTGFVLSSLVENIIPNGVHPLALTPSTNSPAWLAVGLTITNPVNFVQFDSSFTDTNSAQGLVTVYWDTNQIGMVDERVAGTNVQTYRFMLPTTVTSGNYVLGFRLDAFSNTLTSVSVTNVATGFVGVSQPIVLNISFTNGAPLLQLTGPAGYTYLVQSSTNLVDWSPTALLANTNGTVSFVDATASNFSQEFYRAVLFSYIGAAPLLQVKTVDQSIILSWPASATGYGLQTTTNLADPNSWTAVADVPAAVNSQSTVTNFISNGARFYRLKQ